MNISILYGGTSSEHEISIQTGLAVAEAIKDIYNLDMVYFEKGIYQSPHNLLEADLVFNALHGGDGENGTIQAYLDLHHIDYTGSGSKASNIAMDKNISKLIAQSVNIPTPNWILIKRNPHTGLKLQNHEKIKFKGFYPDRIAGGGSHHRYLGEHVAAGIGESPCEG